MKNPQSNRFGSFITGFLILVGALAGVSSTSLDAAEREWFSTDHPHFYAGGGVMQSELEDDDLSDDFGSFGLDDDDNGWRLIWGYQATRHGGLELSYLDLGRFPFQGQIGMNSGRGNSEVQGLTLEPVLRTKLIGPLEAFGKAGVFAWDLDRTGDPSFDLNDDRSVDFSFGAGLDFTLFDPLILRGSWEQFEFDNADVNTVSVHALMRF